MGWYYEVHQLPMLVVQKTTRTAKGLQRIFHSNTPKVFVSEFLEFFHETWGSCQSQLPVRFAPSFVGKLAKLAEL